MRPERALIALALALAGCGGTSPALESSTPAQATATAATPAPTVTQDTGGSTSSPAITSIAVDPGDGTVVVGTGPALYRLAAGGGAARQVSGRLSAPKGKGTVSGQLFVRFAGPGQLLASGHPQGGGLPENLGLIRSGDDGDTWDSLSGLGDADYHELEIGKGVLVGVKADTPNIQVSRDGGRTFGEERTPPAPPIDVAIDPGDAQRWAVSTQQGTFLSTNGGGSWRPREPTTGARLVWNRSGLYSVDQAGSVQRSRDGGRSWEKRGKLAFGPSELAPGRGDDLYAALVGGRILRSGDGGATWKTVATLVG